MEVLYNRLQPSDENTYFENPAVTYVTIAGGVPAVRLCKFNPRRVVLVLGVSEGPVWVSPDQNLVQAAQGSQTGIQLNASSTTLILEQSSVGPICQMDWYAQVPTPVANTVFMTIIEVFLREQPAKVSENETIKSIIRPGGSANGLSRDTRSKRPSLWDMVFSACRSKSNRP